MIEGLTFLSPWILSAAAAIPVIWWLLRVLPPRPRTVRFPAFFLLKDLSASLKTAAHTPWWLLILRSLVIALFVLAFADPVLHPAQDIPGSKGDVLMVVDNGWASASQWQTRTNKIREYLRQAKRGNKPVIFLPTAPAAEDGMVHATSPMEPYEAEEWLNRLKPQPWLNDHKTAAEQTRKILTEHPIGHSFFFSDGLASEETQDLLKLMRTAVTDDTVNNPYILRSGDKNAYTLHRLHAADKDLQLTLLAYTEDGDIADEMKIIFPASQKELEIKWDLLPEVRNRTSRIALQAPGMASTVFLANAQWRQHPVGIIADAAQKENRDFLSEVYYLRRALETNSQITIDPLETLLKGSYSALILPDSTALTPADRDILMKWVEDGGFLIRFGGPNLAANTDDPLLPVPLREGQRAMEGAMTWEKPVHLADIAEESPLFGLSAQQDVTVTRQVLAEPAPEVFEKTWLQLEDGTPLITGTQKGKGTIVLIHTSAGPDWSNFCYSGLFVESLQRMVSLSNGISNYKAETMLPPLMLLDGFGRLMPPADGSAVRPMTPDELFAPSPQSPPGLYGSRQEFKAFNLGDALSYMRELKNIPSEVQTVSYQKTDEIDLKPLLLKLALLLLLLDTLATFWLRGVFARTAPALIAFVMIWHATPAHAAPEPVDLVSGVYLAYMETGDADIDRVSYNGLTALADVLNTRTTIRVKGVTAVNPDKDPLVYYPVIYWPMSENQTGLSVTAAQNIRNYMNSGGMIIFDTRDRQFGNLEDRGSSPGARKLRELTQNILIPELTETPQDHILTRSFYLLDDFPGRYAGGKLWVEKEPSPRHDGATSVLIGSGDWAAAWSRDPRDRARFTIEPGGEMQRELAYRVGVNIVMVALAGNYKADQVHIPHILERIGR